MFTVLEYVREDGSSPYRDWFAKLSAPAAIRETKAMTMALTRDAALTTLERIRRNPEFAKAMLDEAATLFLNGEPDTARLILRDLVNATLGFEGLAVETGRPSKSLHRMLSKDGNPGMANLAAIFDALRRRLGVNLLAQGVEAA